MVRLALYHPKSNYTHYGPEVTRNLMVHGSDSGKLAEWNMREAIGEAAQKVALYLDVPVMQILSQDNEFVIMVKDDGK